MSIPCAARLPAGPAVKGCCQSSRNPVTPPRNLHGSATDFSHSALMAIGAMQLASERGLHCQDDISNVVYNDVSLTARLTRAYEREVARVGNGSTGRTVGHDIDRKPRTIRPHGHACSSVDSSAVHKNLVNTASSYRFQLEDAGCQ